ncbi:MAG: serine protease [Chthoniobacter sp.]|nr:serine protease [Chthoniobacter sp.]
MKKTVSLMALAAFFAVLAWGAETPGVSKGPDKPKPRTKEVALTARAPVAREPFDDREIELYIEAEGRKLLAAERIKKLTFDRRLTSLQLTPPAAEKPGWPEISARAEAATLVLGEFYREGKSKQTQFSVAAGAFVIAETGVCVTCHHVAKERGSRGLVAMTRDGRVFAVREVLAADLVNDLVLLQLDLPADLKLPTIPLALAPAPVGSPIVVMSHPDDRFYMLTTGTVARHTVWRETAGDQVFMTITADFAKGSSGCPVLDERGAVVGIVNNTESIYYDDDGKKKQTDLQMVVKNATPSWIVRKMVTP